MKLGFICKKTSAHFKPRSVNLQRSRFPDVARDLNSLDDHRCERPSKSPMSTASNSSIAIRSRTRSCGRRGKVKSAQASLRRGFIRGIWQKNGGKKMKKERHDHEGQNRRKFNH